MSLLLSNISYILLFEQHPQRRQVPSILLNTGKIINIYFLNNAKRSFRYGPTTERANFAVIVLLNERRRSIHRTERKLYLRCT